MDETGALAFMAEQPELVDRAVESLAAKTSWSHSDEWGQIEIRIQLPPCGQSWLMHQTVSPTGETGWGKVIFSKGQLEPPFDSLRFYVASYLAGMRSTSE
jgi:hypothetical protein